MTHYIAAYDTESAKCLAATRKIVEMHRRHEMPGTFFVTGKTLEANPTEYLELLDDPLFEVSSHTLSHKMLRDQPWCGPAATADQIRTEIFQGKEWVEKVFERECPGLRPGCCFVDGLKGAPDVIGQVVEAGFLYVSSQAWGKDYSLPAPLNQPFTYEQDGFPDLWELPAHGWHENLLKDNNRWGPLRLTLWPSEWPEAIPDGFIETPEEEVAVHRVFLDRAVREDLTFVSLIWHPWSLDAFDPEMRMLDKVFSHVQDLQLEPCTYEELFRKVSR